MQPGLRVGGHLALTDFGQRNHSELSHMADAVDDSTINIVVVIIIIIIIIIIVVVVLPHSIIFLLKLPLNTAVH